MSYTYSHESKFSLFCEGITEKEIKDEILFQFSGIHAVKVKRVTNGTVEVSFRSRKYGVGEVKKEIDTFILKQQMV